MRYERQILPGPIITHTVWVALDTPGLEFLLTPLDMVAGGELHARTVSHFLDKYELQIAVNGDFFEPWRDVGFWDYYPHTGDPVSVQGISASQGNLYSDGYDPPNNASVYVSRDNRVSFAQPVSDVYNAITSNIMLITDGSAYQVSARDNEYLSNQHPRAAISLNQTQDTLILVVDGRQPNYSIGMTIPELIAHLENAGAYNAVNLGRGGSSTLVTADANGNPMVMNSPIHDRIPGREQPVANHFGLRIVATGEGE
jgi:exopolysaccharide biosynthesis protein